MVSGWFGQGLFSDIRQCVIAQDRASEISSKSTSSGLQENSIFLFLHRFIRYIILILYTNIPTIYIYIYTYIYVDNYIYLV